MRVEGSYRFPAGQERVFALLLDPDALRACIPGCERLEPIGEDHYEATMKVGVAAVRGTYKGEVRIEDRDAPNSYRMSVQGRGGPGFVKGTATITVTAVGDAESEVVVVGDGQIGGMIAGVAQRLIGGVANMMMNQFFDCLRKQLG
jgi:carbon monoxide dehydrogenase subunit G